ncbi:peptidylprolyl isomerase [Phenylobacterium sp.]|uniref:peptidylprolyl isomerase n=1 Tax=Phenylobacterium sp. TaxID=1871053 RepID=UPI002DEB7CEA|nr:peptidylprolyl isomerase [Phenylobacterium sp.]
MAQAAPRTARFDPAVRGLRRIAREPLVHFLIIGGLLFGGLQLVRGAQRPSVTISEQDLNQLVAYWELQSGRPPTRQELQAIVRDRVDEELLAHEAHRLGLDKDDMIIRRRLAQKMAFASEDLGAVAEPDEATLRAFYDRRRAQYPAPAHVTLRHAFFSGDRGAEAARAAAIAALARARRGEDPGGDPFLLPLTYADASLDDIERDYGAAYARAVRIAPLGTWIGPVPSAYGFHVVRVEGRQGATTARFETVRDEVRDAWLADRRAAANAAFLDSLRKRYRVVVAGQTP